ncbi:hypothetical protein [Rhizobium sp. BK251]|uniref:hypothetical protein n=1 Tax=Rhizobium sp. BK251 TaxID=2512125 RepID=UPI00104C15CB|nr:hypothetical protein [Rhizobium sp. BK251]TCL70462.1 hypothetical protein EV286_107336 [Rhizobium sp. BK251]
MVTFLIVVIILLIFATNADMRETAKRDSWKPEPVWLPPMTDEQARSAQCLEITDNELRRKLGLLPVEYLGWAYKEEE